jgi:hypothetical protein
MSQALLLNQLKQLENPDGRIMLGGSSEGALLSNWATAPQGLKTGDDNRFRRQFWECDSSLNGRWRRYQSTPSGDVSFSGMENAIDWFDDGQSMARLQGETAWGKSGLAVGQMRSLPVGFYSGDIQDSNVNVILPKRAEYAAAIATYVNSDEFKIECRKLDQKIAITNATMVKVPFDLEHWQKVADERYPDGLPEPHSDDPTQWLFLGDIPSSTDPLHVAMARLLGYEWPDQLDDDLGEFLDSDGIVTLTPLVNQAGVANRLRALLQAAYESPAPARPKGAPLVEEPRVWDESTLPRLLARAGSPGMSLEDWLRDKFFDAHSKLFHQRPFLWHIWDGRKDGFHAIVNYHKLDSRNLDRLTHVYLGEWIDRQRAVSDAGDQTADARLIAAQELQKKLELIRIGEPPYDIFVRWKSLEEQPLGWEPDLNDGVRMNIRPFVYAGMLRGKVNVSWTKDRGKDPKPNISKTTERHNDIHIDIKDKLTARGIK